MKNNSRTLKVSKGERESIKKPILFDDWKKNGELSVEEATFFTRIVR